MKYISGQIENVRILHDVRSAGSSENNKTETHFIHQFSLNGRSYQLRLKKAINLVNGDSVSVALGLFSTVKRIYNNTNGEYSHPKPPIVILSTSIVVAAIVFMFDYIAKNPFLHEQVFYKRGITQQSIFNYSSFIIGILILLGIRNIYRYEKIKNS